MSAGQDDLNLSNGDTKLLLDDDDDDDAPKPLPLLLDEKAQALVTIINNSRVADKKGVDAIFVQDYRALVEEVCDV